MKRKKGYSMIFKISVEYPFFTLFRPSKQTYFLYDVITLSESMSLSQLSKTSSFLTMM